MAARTTAPGTGHQLAPADTPPPVGAAPAAPVDPDLDAQIAAEVADAVAATMAARRRYAPRDTLPLTAAMARPAPRRPNAPRPNRERP